VPYVFCFPLLSQVLTQRGRTRHRGFLEDREACLPSRRGAGAACIDWIVQWMKITELVRIWRTWRADACDRCGVRGSPEWSVPCEQTECPPPSRDRCEDGMTCARTCWLLSLFFCLLWKWMLEPLLLSCERGCLQRRLR
jgi:hypothetical protein